jgi:hypothetical protein
MTDQEMKTLLEEIRNTQLQLLRLGTSSITPPQIEFNEPATDSSLNLLASHLAGLNLKTPPSYRQLLRVSDGIARFRWLQSFSFRSVQTLIQKSEDDAAWDDLAEDYSEFDIQFGPVHHFIIGTGDVTAVCAFDPDSIDEYGEMKVIEFDIEGNEPIVHDNLEALLRSDLATYKSDLARASELTR